MKSMDSLNIIREEVVNCTLCPRLVKYREEAPERASHQDENYWRRPVPGFGDPKAWLLLTGLAPSPQGGNRTGRLFTGDDSAKFLMKVLYDMEFANQPTSESLDDGLKLNGVYMTAAVKCVPPEHRPTREEMETCNQYYFREFDLLTNVTSILAFGKIAFDAALMFARRKGCSVGGMQFVHGGQYKFRNLPTLYASYHPSPQNTNTGVLTEKMLIDLLRTIQREGGKNS